MAHDDIPAAIAALDRHDPVASMRAQFALPHGLIYLDGNSLGALPKAAQDRIAAVVSEQWGHSLIRAWNDHDWIGLPARVGDKIARLIGAAAGEVIAADSTSVNLFKLIAAAVKAQPGRTTLLSEHGNFPTDLYMLEGVASALPGLTIRTVPAKDLEAAIDHTTALVLLTHVHYKSGLIHDMARLTELAHAAGALILWDLSHSAGAVPVDLNGCAADMAVGCGYKYLNGGPGAPAFVFVAGALQDRLRSPLSGWMGHAAPFAFDDRYDPAPGIGRFLCGTPGIIAMSGLDAALDVFLSVAFETLIAKGRALGNLFIAEVDTHAADLDLISPRDAVWRGNQVALRHPDGYAIMQALIAEGVIGDFRAPDILRFGFAPLYTRYVDVWRAAQKLAQIMASGRWKNPEFARRAVVT